MTGVYSGTVLSMSLAIACAVSLNEPRRLSAIVTAFNVMSPTASVIDAAATATTRPPKDVSSVMRRLADTPASPPTSDREKVQITNRVYGRPQSSMRADAATIIAGRGPYTTAAKRIGSAETDICVVAVM